MTALGLDFGTTNTVLARIGAGDAAPTLVALDDEASVYRTALCFWHEAGARDRVGARGQPSRLEGEGLPEHALDAVSLDGAADLPRHGQAQARSVIPPAGEDVEDELAPGV